MMNWGDTLKWVLKIVAVVLGVAALLGLLRLGLGVFLYAFIGRWATSQLGLDYYPAEFVAVTLSTLILYFVPGVSGIFFWRRNRLRNAALLIGGYLVVCVLVYTVGGDVYFDQTTGEALRYYVDTPEGRKFSFLPGVDPRWGLPRQPYTREVAEEELRQRQQEEGRRRKAEAERQQAEAERRLQAEAQLRRQEEETRRQQERERLRQEAEARRAYELEQQRLAADEQARQLEQERLLAARRQEEAQERQRAAEERRLEQERAAAEREREWREEQQRREQEARERAAREERERAAAEARRREEEARQKRDRNGRLIDFGRREIERRTGRRIPWPN